MKRKLLMLLLAATIGFTAVACNSGGDATDPASNESTDPDDDNGTDAPDDNGDIDTSEFVTITYMTTADTPTNTATTDMLEEMNAILKDKVNAELDIYYIGWTDYLANYNLALATMDGSIDLVGTASDWLDAWQNAKNGAFLALPEEMLQTYAPLTWETVPAENWDQTRYEGDIYMMPEDNYAQWVNHGFIYRLDWAQDAGLADGANSWEDMTEYFRYVKETYPDMIPWDSDGTHNVQLASGWIQSHTDFVAIDGLSTGGLWGGTRDDLYNIVTPFYTETDMLVEFAKLMKEWDEIGVWRTDVLNNTSSTNRDDYSVGLTAADQHHTQTWTGLVSHTVDNVIYQDDPNAASGFFYFGQESGNLTAMSITHGAMAISAASKNPERALMVYDLMRNDQEVYNLLNYGQEGRQYVINDDGLRETPDSYDPDADGLATSYWWGRNDDLEIRSANLLWDSIDALYDEYAKISIDYPYGQFVPEVANIQAQINNVNEQHSNYMKQIAFGKYQGTAEDIVAEYQAAIGNAGIEEVTEELQRQIDELYN